MIRPININLNAAHPELPLVEATTFTGAPSSVFIRGVPKAVGNWSITAVSVAVTYPDNSTTSRAAVESAEGVWVATIPGTATSGRTVAGFRITADGIDENGAAVTGYVLGFADFSVLSFTPVPAPGGTFWLLRYFDTMPTTPKKGDVAKIGGVLEFYNGTAWEAFDARAYSLAAQASNNANDLRRTLTANYYTSAQTDAAIERVAAYYITYTAAGAAFPTRADLLNAQTYYSGGVARVPTRNDYAVVLADESHGGAEWRYIYAVADGATTGQWEAQYPVEGVITYDNTVTPTSANGVKSSGIWSAIWGALSALPTGFSSLYDWCVAQIARLRDKLDLNVYGYGNATVALPGGFSITFYDQTYTTPAGGETITFVGPVPSSSPYSPNDKFYYPSTLGTLDAFDPNDYSVWCLVCLSGGDTPDQLMYKTGPSYSISGWNSAAPTLALSNGEATGDAPTMTRPIAATSDTLAKVSQLAGKQDALSAQQLANIAAVPNKADASAIPYTLGTPTVINTASSEVVEGETVYYGAATLADRTANIVQVTAATALDELRITFPAATSGKVRDFGLRVEVGTGSAALTAPALVPIAPTGETIKIENNAAEIPALADGTATAKGVTLLYFSENAPGVFVVKGEQVEEVA